MIIESKIDSVLESGENADRDGVAYQANLVADNLEKELAAAKAETDRTKQQLDSNK